MDFIWTPSENFKTEKKDKIFTAAIEKNPTQTPPKKHEQGPCNQMEKIDELKNSIPIDTVQTLQDSN